MSKPTNLCPACEDGCSRLCLMVTGEWDNPTACECPECRFEIEDKLHCDEEAPVDPDEVGEDDEVAE